METYAITNKREIFILSIRSFRTEFATVAPRLGAEKDARNIRHAFKTVGFPYNEDFFLVGEVKYEDWLKILLF